MIDNHPELITALGGQQAVANMLGIHRRDVWWWVHRGQPDKKWRPLLIALADKFSVQLDPTFRAAWTT